jgi:fructose-1,6-bisphosphatase I
VNFHSCCETSGWRPRLSREVNKAGITNILGEEGSQNVHGESVKKLDLFADDQLISALDRSNITCMVISEEND